MKSGAASHYFHAEAHALEGKLRLPFEDEIKKQAYVKLEGKLANLATKGRAKRNCFSQTAAAFRLEGILSYAGAHTQVSGQDSEKRAGASVTLATSVVEELNVLNVVTADRVVAQIATTHFPGEYTPEVTFLGTHFENLRIACHQAEPYLKIDFLGARAAGRDAMPVDPGTDFMQAVEAQYKSVKARIEALPEDDRRKMGLAGTDEWLAKKYHGFHLNYTEIEKQAHAAKKKDDQGRNSKKKDRNSRESEWGGITCSLVENVEIKGIDRTAADGKSVRVPPPAKTFGHVIHIPDFGNVFLAELTVKHNSCQLTMIRLDMGCLASGILGLASANVNGRGTPGSGL